MSGRTKRVSTKGVSMIRAISKLLYKMTQIRENLAFSWISLLWIPLLVLLENGIPRLEQYEKPTSQSNDSRNWGGNPHERFSFAPAFSERFFRKSGWSPRAEHLNLQKAREGRAVAVPGVCSGVPEQKSRENSWNFFPDREMLQISEVSKRVSGRGLATNNTQNTAKKCPSEWCSPTSRGGIGKRGPEKRPEFMVWEGFPCANPLCPPTPFRNF